MLIELDSPTGNSKPTKAIMQSFWKMRDSQITSFANIKWRLYFTKSIHEINAQKHLTDMDIRLEYGRQFGIDELEINSEFLWKETVCNDSRQGICNEAAKEYFFVFIFPCWYSFAADFMENVDFKPQFWWKSVKRESDSLEKMWANRYYSFEKM